MCGLSCCRRRKSFHEWSWYFSLGCDLFHFCLFSLLFLLWRESNKIVQTDCLTCFCCALWLNYVDIFRRTLREVRYKVLQTILAGDNELGALLCCSLVDLNLFLLLSRWSFNALCGDETVCNFLEFSMGNYFDRSITLSVSWEQVRANRIWIYFNFFCILQKLPKSEIK